MLSREFAIAEKAIKTNNYDLFASSVRANPKIVRELKPDSLFSLLHYAAYYCKSDTTILNELIGILKSEESLGEVILSNSSRGDTPVHLAAIASSAKNLQLLFEADYEAAAKASRWPNNKGKIPLQLLHKCEMAASDYSYTVNLLENAMLHYDFKPLSEPMRLDEITGYSGEDTETLENICVVANQIRSSTKSPSHPEVRESKPAEFLELEQKYIATKDKRDNLNLHLYSYWDALNSERAMVASCHGFSTRFAHKLSHLDSRLKIDICAFTDETGDHVWNVVNDAWIVDSWSGTAFHKSFMSSELRDLTVVSELRHGFEKPVVLFANFQYHVIEVCMTLFPIRCPRVALAESNESNSNVSNSGIFGKTNKKLLAKNDNSVALPVIKFNSNKESEGGKNTGSKRHPS